MLMATQFVFLSYGSDAAVHRQTMAAVATLFASYKAVHRPRPEILIYTDRANYFEWIEPTSIVELDKKKLEAWMGPQRFHLRVKGCLLAEVASSASRPICFLDSDMLILKDLCFLDSGLAEGAVYLQTREYLVSDRSTKERREFMNRLKGVDLGDGITLGESSWMWNSGLIGLAEEAFCAPKEVVAIIDKMMSLGLSPRTRLKEQLAFSLYLDQRFDLHEAGDAVTHYWGNKPAWNAWLDNWLLDVQGRGLDAEAAGRLLLERPNRPAAIAPKRSRAEKRKAKLRKLFRLD